MDGSVRNNTQNSNRIGDTIQAKNISIPMEQHNGDQQINSQSTVLTNKNSMDRNAKDLNSMRQNINDRD